MKTIYYTIKKGGKVTIETSGFTGTECLEATRAVEEALGVVQSSELKAEFHETAAAEQHVSR